MAMDSSTDQPDPDPQSAEADMGGAEGDGAAPTPEGRSFTIRALLIGALLAALAAIIVPWNDWGLKNTTLFNNYMPPVVILALLGLGFIVNPLLGSWRLRRGELVVVTVMLLGVGGVASSGLMRFWPSVVTYPQRLLAKSAASYETLQQELDDETIARLAGELESEVSATFDALDRSQDGRLSPVEYLEARSFAAKDVNGDGTLDLSEVVAAEGGDTTYGAAVLARDDRNGNAVLEVEEVLDVSRFNAIDTNADGSLDLGEYADSEVPTWRWPLSGDLFMGIPEAGGIDETDPELHYQAGRYLDGVTKAEEPRIDYRSRVTWQDAEGNVFARELALRGPVADAYRASDRRFLELDGSQLAGLKAGDTGMIPSDHYHTVAAGDTLTTIAEAAYGADAGHLGSFIAAANNLEGEPAIGTRLMIPSRIQVLKVDNPPIPWGVWLGYLLTWSPLLFGALVAMVAIAGLVRRQWIDHERLPYPIAEVTLTLLETPKPGSRLAPVFTTLGFRIGLLVTFAIVAWNGLALYEWVPTPIATSLDLYNDGGPFAGSPWNQAYKPQFLFHPRIYFSLVALVFFLPLDLGFSLWFFFVLTGVVTIITGSGGIPLQEPHLTKATVGGYVVMAGLILWMGRSYYLSVLKAAFVGHRDPAIREAVPYVWGLLMGVFLMVGFLVMAGAPLWPSILVVLMFLGALLVIARLVAEAGIPFLQTPNGAWLNTVLFSIIGVGFPVQALVPLTFIGMTLLADSRESLMPYAVNAGYLGHKTRTPARRLSLTVLLAASIGGVLAMGSMVMVGHNNGALQKDAWPSMVVRDNALRPIATERAEMERGADAQGRTGADRLAEKRTESWIAYGTGGVITALLGFARMLFAWWPLHPLGYLTSTSYPVWLGWFSFCLGWSIKAVVMRYGGTAIYQKLKPLMIGIIAGEALALGLYFLIKVIAFSAGIEAIKTPGILPG